MWQEKWLGKNAWNNNNCESVNHMLKLAIDWKPQQITNLVHHLRTVVNTQYSDLKRSLCGQGEFYLAPQFAEHSVSYSRWTGMSGECQNERFEAFMNDTGIKSKTKTVKSSDGLLTVQSTSRVARKPGQTRRPRACRTHSQ